MLRALSARALAATGSPVSAYHLLDTLTRHLSIDAGWSARDMAGLMLSLRDLSRSDVHYLTIPVTGTGMVGNQSVVFVDRAAGGPLWQAVRQDTMPAWLRAHPGAVDTSRVR